MTVDCARIETRWTLNSIISKDNRRVGTVGTKRVEKYHQESRVNGVSQYQVSLQSYSTTVFLRSIIKARKLDLKYLRAECKWSLCLSWCRTHQLCCTRTHFRSCQFELHSSWCQACCFLEWNTTKKLKNPWHNSWNWILWTLLRLWRSQFFLLNCRSRILIPNARNSTGTLIKYACP